MKHLLLASCVFILALLSCKPSEKESTENVSDSTQTTASIEQKKIVIDEDSCFDQKMEKWYQAFNEYQDKGDDMQTADKKAFAIAEADYNACVGK
jgi:hypothetical protein